LIHMIFAVAADFVLFFPLALQIISSKIIFHHSFYLL